MKWLAAIAALMMLFLGFMKLGLYPADDSWTTTRTLNPLTKGYDVRIQSEQTSGGGSIVAEVTGLCESGIVVFYVLITDDDGKAIKLPATSDATPAKIRIDNEPIKQALLTQRDYLNQLNLIRFMPKADLARASQDKAVKDITAVFNMLGNLTIPAETTASFVAEIPTAQGPAFIKILTKEPAIKGLFKACFDEQRGS